VGKESDYPYVLYPFRLLSNRTGAGSSSPLLQEMFGYYHGVYWRTWVELNPETARKHHLEEGDWVRVESTEGSISGVVVFNPALQPETVAVPFGMGHTAGGRYAENIGANPYDVLAPEHDNVGGWPAEIATRVRLVKIGRKAV
jgi:molybdopterin-containing oxidoreductase family iron-sulfur binding subunit